MGSWFGCHQAALLKNENGIKTPLVATRKITSININDTGDLVERRGGSLDYATEHFQGPKQAEIQITSKEWFAELLNVATGGLVSRLTDNPNIKVIDSRNALMTIDYPMTNPGAKATATFNDEDGTATIRFTAKEIGTDGNDITVAITKNVASADYVIKRGVVTETYSTVAIADAATTLAASTLVDVEVLSTAKEPETAVATNLAGGLDKVNNTTDAFFGTFMLRFNGQNWDLYLLDDSDTSLRANYDLKFGQSLNLQAGNVVNLGIGLTAQLDNNYNPAENDYVIFTLIPDRADIIRSWRLKVSQGDRRPYVSLVASAESQGDLVNIYVPKMKCSSGLPMTLAEKTDNEFQLTFMTSLESDTGSPYEVTAAERFN